MPFSCNRKSTNFSSTHVRICVKDTTPLQEEHDLLLTSKKKTCSLDTIPTKLVFECLDFPLPVITKIINYSLEHDVFLSAWRNALVFPLLKKDGLGPKFKKSIDL